MINFCSSLSATQIHSFKKELDHPDRFLLGVFNIGPKLCFLLVIVTSDRCKEKKSCGKSQKLRNFPHASTGGWVGSQHLLCLFVSFRVLTCVCLGPSVQLNTPDFFGDILVLVCVVAPTKVPGLCAETPALSCLAFDCTDLVLTAERV